VPREGLGRRLRISFFFLSILCLCAVKQRRGEDGKKLHAKDNCRDLFKMNGIQGHFRKVFDLRSLTK